MFKTLRRRIALTAALPLLLIMPLLALFLIASLEDFYGRRLADDLQAQGLLMVDQLSAETELAHDPATLQVWLAHIDRSIPTRVVVVSRQGIILGATEAEDRARLGQRSSDEGIAEALNGRVVSGSRFGAEATADIAFVALPLPPSAEPLGAIRLSLRLAESQSHFFELRALVIAGTALSLLVALVASLALAGTLAYPLRRLNAITRAALGGDYRQRAQPTGMVEIDDLIESYNTLAAGLARQVALRQALLADIAHELGRPLGALHSASEALLSGAVDQPELSKQLLVGMEAESARLGRLAQSLNDLSLDQIAAPQLRRSRVDLRALLQQATARFGPEIQQASIRLVACLPDDLPMVWADPDRLTQVLNNLLDNARKFTPAGGTITLAAGHNAQWVWLSVGDTGAGIDAVDQQRIFERFYRTDYAPPIQQGLGLGLAIAQEIVRAHSGCIEVTSERGKGSTFTVKLPREHAALPSPALSLEKV